MNFTSGDWCEYIYREEANDFGELMIDELIDSKSREEFSLALTD